MKKKKVIAMALLLGLSQTFSTLGLAAVSTNSTTRMIFKKNVDTQIYIENINERVFFSQCTGGHCKVIGKDSGYTQNELQKGWRRLLRQGRLVRYGYIPAVTLCGVLLGGAIGLAASMPMFELTGEIVRESGQMIVEAPMEIPNHMLNGMERGLERNNPAGAIAGAYGGAVVGSVTMPAKMAVGTMGMSMGLVTGSLGVMLVSMYALYGFAIGVPASWVSSKIFFSNKFKPAKAIKNAAQKKEMPEELVIKGSPEKFVKNLERALNSI